MKKDTELRITIIGLGNLMEAIFPCIVRAIGRENLSRRVNATTTDRPDLKRKQEALGISVILDDNLAALKKNKADIIFFAPPPRVAPGLILSDLKDYFTYLREISAALPEIFAFPPTPPCTFYEEILGEDIRVVNLLPHPVTTLGGKLLENEGYYSRTFGSAWQPENKARVKRIFQTMGEGVDLKTHEIVPMMGGWIMFEVLSEAVTTIADTIERQGQAQDHRILARHMRETAQRALIRSQKRSHAAETEFLGAPLKSFLDNVTVAWYEGIRDYFQEVGFPHDLSRTILNMLMDFQLHILEVEERNAVDAHTSKAATKGGVLEKGLHCYHRTIERILKAPIKQVPEKTTAEWKDRLCASVKEAAHVVRRHGMTLSG